MPLLLLSNPVGASGFGELVKARATLKSATAARSFMIPTSLAKDAQRKYHLARPRTSVKGVPGGEVAARHHPVTPGWSATLRATCKAAENDCLERRNSIRPCVPSHVAYKAERGGNELFWSPWTMYPRSQERRRNREATVYLPALGGAGLGLIVRSEYTNARKRRHPKRA